MLHKVRKIDVTYDFSNCTFYLLNCVHLVFANVFNVIADGSFGNSEDGGGLDIA